jgi:molybdopterin/thiamine biosynthesis adenylyltransferase/rhodanese-related sulfurtransferase
MQNLPHERVVAGRRPREIDVHELRSRMDAGAPVLLVDVREDDEVELGVISGAVHVRAGDLGARAESAAPDKNRPVVLYCAVGQRSLFAADLMERLGYRDAVSLRGGIEAWRRAGYPVSDEDATARRLRRDPRHIRISEIGRAGQLKLLESRVLVVGAGGLGSPSAIYLAAAGVGTLGIIDDDVVDETNLQRQIVHKARSIGVAKTDSAKETLRELNPDVRVETHGVRLEPANALEIIRGYDVVIDGCDNFATKYLVNDACVLAGIPDVYGSILRFEGQVTVFQPGSGPCYRCLYPEAPPAEASPSCAEAGVLGVLPGVIGVLQATEVLKLLLGIGRPLVGRLLQYDALEARFREFRIRRDAHCPVCGDEPALRSMDDYDAFRVEDACGA